MNILIKIFLVLVIIFISAYINNYIPGLGVLLIILAILIYYIIKLYNNLIAERNMVKNTWSKIDIQLNKRADLIENMVETVRGYSIHEKDILIDVAKARSNLLNSDTVPDIQRSNQKLTKSLMNLYSVVENYPNIKANNNFLELQNELKEIEYNIAYYREEYNNAVLIYNNSCEQFPNNLIASIFNFQSADFLKVNESKKELPKVQF